MIKISVIFTRNFNCKFLNKSHYDGGDLQIVDEEAVAHYIFGDVGEGLFGEEELVGLVFGEGCGGD